MATELKVRVTVVDDELNIADRDDLRIPMTAAEFLAEAWRLANDKARKLGWLV